MNNNQKLIDSEARIKRRIRKERALKGFVYTVSCSAIIIFLALIGFIFYKGGGLISIGLLISDYEDLKTDVYTEEQTSNFTMNRELKSGEHFSKPWGIAFLDSENKEGKAIVIISYVDESSPLKKVLDNNNKKEDGTPIEITLEENTTIREAYFDSGAMALSIDGAKEMKNVFDINFDLSHIAIQKDGGGIRGSLITTFYLIILTLIIAVPFGVATAIYLNEYAKKGRITKWLRTLIELLTGIPSIIYGLMGAAVFIPFVNGTFGTSGGSIISGAFTMAVILLPVIIKSTEEALKVIPKDARDSSLALGASKTQTIFKIVLPSAVPGILTGVLLGIGRIIGESAALIFAVGAVIKDDIFLTKESTTLAVHIWKVMGGDNPNFELACAIAIIILFVVVILSILVKLVAKKLNKAWY